MIHIRKLDVDADFTDAYYGNQVGGLKVKEGEPWLSYTEAEDEVNYSKNKLNPLNIPLTFRALVDDSDIEFCFDGSDDEYYREIKYSINNGPWQYVSLGDGGNNVENYQFPTLNSGDTISFAGDNDCYYESTPSGEWIWSIQTTAGSFEVYGNIMSMINSNTFYYNISLRDAIGTFCYFFINSTSLVDASNLVLPSFTLYNLSYSNMFQGCTNLVYPPKRLPAMTLTHSCYSGMFKNCTSLIRTPELPATTIKDSGCYFCYSEMFSGCTSLVEVPDRLLISSVTVSCYYRMFYGCTSLIRTPELPATTLGNDCYEEMFKGCTNLRSAPIDLPATTVVQNCYRQMFYGCTNLERAPKLPAETLVNSCYYQMFYGCTKLHYVNCSAIRNINNNYTYQWLYNVSSNGTFVSKYPSLWPRNTSGNPSNWNFQLTMWIDDFPDYLPEYDGCEDWYDWYDSCYSPEAGDEFIYTEETFDYDGETFFLWENTNWSESMTREGFAYALTRTINFDVLNAMAVEHDFFNRHDDPKCCPIYVFLSIDEEYGYCKPCCNDGGYVLSCIRR